MKIADGTSSARVVATAIMGFIGHASQGHFEPDRAVLFAVIAVLGGLLGGRFAIKTKLTKLKKAFAYTTLAAAVFMILILFLHNNKRINKAISYSIKKDLYFYMPVIAKSIKI